MSQMPDVDRIAGSRAAVLARQARAKIKADLRGGKKSYFEVFDEALADPSSPAGTLRVREYIATLPAVGKVKTKRIMEDLAISPSKRLGGLGSLQRVRLRKFLEEARAKALANDVSQA